MGEIIDITYTAQALFSTQQGREEAFDKSKGITEWNRWRIQDRRILSTELFDEAFTSELRVVAFQMYVTLSLPS